MIKSDILATIVGCLQLRLPTISGRNFTRQGTLAPEECRREAVHWIVRTGAQWRELLPSVFKRFRSLGHMFKQFAQDPDMQLMPDSTVCPYERSGRVKKGGPQQEQCLGSRGGFSDPSPLESHIDRGWPMAQAESPCDYDAVIAAKGIPTRCASCSQANR